jgi:hypothetical protein
VPTPPRIRKRELLRSICAHLVPGGLTLLRYAACQRQVEEENRRAVEDAETEKSRDAEELARRNAEEVRLKVIAIRAEALTMVSGGVSKTRS